MRLLEFKRAKNYMWIKVERALDLFYLQELIEKNDLITAKTVRTIFMYKYGKKEKVGRKAVRLTLKVEKIGFDKTTNKLRVKGTIVEGPEEVPTGAYHTIEIRIGSVFKLEKSKWKDKHLEIIDIAKLDIGYVKTKKILEEFYMHVYKDDGLAAYGLEDVKMATSIGAVDTLIIPESVLDSKEIRDLAKEVGKKGGKVRLLPGKNRSSKKFSKTYRVGAILRFRIR